MSPNRIGNDPAMTGPRHAYIGVDVGTSGCKAVLLDDSGAVRHTAWRGYKQRRTTEGEVSQDPRDWATATAQTLRACGIASRDGGLEVAAIATTAPAHTAVLVDQHGDPLERAILPYDQRCAKTAERMRTSYGDEFFDRTFVRLGTSWTLPQLAWLREHAPGIWPRIRHMLITKDFVTFLLTGQPVTDPSDAAGTGMYDQRTGAWAADLCRDAGLDAAHLPPIRRATDVAGGLTREWSSITGIPAGTPVIVGATDTAAELYSLNLVTPGSGLVKIASTGTIVAVLEEPHPDPRTLTYPHVSPGLWYTLTATNTAAVAFSWLRETVFAAPQGTPAATYAEMDAVASSVPAGAEGVLFLPFLDGERSPYWDPHLRASFLGLSGAHRRPHLSRAVLEGVCFSLRDCRDLLRSLGVEVSRPILTGGGVESELWRTILASVLGVVCDTASPQGPAIGSAYLAAAAVGGSAPSHNVPSPKPALAPVEPRAGWRATYDNVYPIYIEAARRVAGLSHDLVAGVSAAVPEIAAHGQLDASTRGPRHGDAE
jgi:xylulokinase